MHGYRAYNCALLKWWENEFFRLLDKLEFVYCLVLKTIWNSDICPYMFIYRTLNHS